MSMATKHGQTTTYNEVLPLIKSRDTSIASSYEVT